MTDAAASSDVTTAAGGARSPDRGTILFAQLDRFSYTNDALLEHLGPRLAQAGYRLEGLRVYRRILKHPVYSLLCLLAVAAYFGPRALFQRKLLNERFIKTPVFFRLAGRYLRRHGQRTPDLKAVFQTQGLFNAKVPGRPFAIYTDNTILNGINRQHTQVPMPAEMPTLERRTYEAADRIAVSAGHVRRSLIDDYRIATDRVEVVYIGANVSRIVAAEEGRFEQQEILFVGIDWERKGGPTLLEAFRMVAEEVPTAHLTIAGCAPPVDHPNVTVLGRVPPDEIARLMARSSVFCLPSIVEPSSVAAIEAASAGLPIVATRTGGFLDSVADGVSGILVEPGDTAALAAALTSLIRDPEACARMGGKGREWVAKFNWPLVSAQIADILVEQIER